MREALAICRDHGQSPGWWDGLPAGERALLLADRRLRLREDHAATRGR